MVGIPMIFNTKEDWFNSVVYVETLQDTNGALQLVERLRNLDVGIKRLEPNPRAVAKQGADSAFISVEDMVLIEDPMSPMATSGLSKKDITALINRLTKVKNVVDISEKLEEIK